MSPSPTEIAFTLTITMRSDWHVGTGGGRHGAIDRLIERDVDDLPFIPASTVRGIWRDAAERLAYGLDGGTTGSTSGWAALVEALFGDQPVDRTVPDGGTPKPGCLSIAAGRLPPDLRDALWQQAQGGDTDPGRRRLRQALTFVKPGVQIDPQSGRVTPKFLRFEEVARQGAVLTAQGRLLLHGDPGDRWNRALAAVLVGSTGMVERLGGKRRRGAGRSTWSIAIDDRAVPVRDLDGAIAVLKQEAPKAPDGPAPTPAPAFGAATPADGWETVALDLDLVTPLVIAEAVLGNVVTSFDFIPGTYLLPYVAKRLETVARGGPPVSAAITAGDIRVGHATPILGGERSLPIPLAWQREKDDTGGPDGKGKIYNRLVECPLTEGQTRPMRSGYVRYDAERPKLLTPEGQTRPMRSGYVRFDPNHPTLLTAVDTVVRTHNRIDDAVQRPTENGVYSYEAISPGRLRYRAMVRVRTDVARRLPNWQAAVAPTDPVELRLGRATKAGYGVVRLSAGPAVKAGNSGRQDQAANTPFTVWLTSDVLLRSPLLGTGSALGDWVTALGDALGVTVEAVEPTTPDQVTYGLRLRRLESWVAAWQLPRPSLIALQAGSFVTVTATQTVPGPALEALERNGLGERRAEGFGEVWVDPPHLTEEASGWSDASRKDRPERRAEALPPPLAGLPKDDPTRRFAKAVETAAWEAFVEEAAFTLANDDDWRKESLHWDAAKGKPPMSQLGALRAAMGAYADAHDVASARQWFTQMTESPARADKWGQKARAALKTMLDPKGPDDAARIWAWLEALGTPLPAPLVTDRDRLQERFRQAAVRDLLLAAMQAHKRSIERPADDHGSPARQRERIDG